MKRGVWLIAGIWGIIFNTFAQNNQRSAFQGLSLFENTITQVQDEKVKTGVILELRKKVVQAIAQEKPERLKVLIPSADGQSTWALSLEKNEVVSKDFFITTSDGQRIQTMTLQEKAVHYKGKLEGTNPSMVAMSFFDGSMMGVISVGNTNYDIGAMVNDPSGRYVLYDANNLYKELPFNCIPVTPKGTNQEINYSIGSTYCERAGFKVYYESDYQMYLDKGSNTTNVVNYVTGLHNVVNVLYNNEGLNSLISEIFVWTSADPFRTITTSSTYLSTFRSTRTTFNGNLAHLLSTRPTNLGGIAYLDVICNTPNRYAFSNISNSYSLFPTYSWSVMVVTHELGHNLGSPHTQSCTWPGGALDNCYTTEGGCAAGPAPTNGGTIMSYCHLTSNGINLNNGFGLLPGNLIRNRTLNASCLDLAAGSTALSLGCIPTTTNPFNNTGIGPVQVQLRNIDFTSPSANNGVFTDYSCTIGDSLVIGNNYTLRVKTTGGNRQNVRAYIDYNGNNIFEATELVLSSNGATTGDVWHQANVIVPATALLNTPIRMRVLSEFNGTSNPQPCGTLPYGQAEDYALFILSANNIQTGILSASSVCSGSSINVPFIATGTFNAGNVFSAQLSDTSGSFTNNPVIIGSLSSTISGSINATVPIGTATGYGYKVRVISSNPGLTGSLSSTNLIITSTQTPSISIAITEGSSNICSGTTVSFTATVSNAGLSPVYQWKINGGNVGTNSPVFSTSSLINGQTVSCMLTSNAACTGNATANSNSINVTVNNLPSPSITGTNTICSGQSTTLTASGGTSYLWNTGATSAAIIISPVTTSTYTVTATNASGCSAVISRTVTVNPLITPAFNPIIPFCSGETAPVLPSTSLNGIAGIWTPSIVNNISSSTYTFTPNGGQCAGSATLSVTVLPTPTTAITPNNPTICSGQSTTLTASGGSSYLWNTGATTSAITVSPVATTTYSVIATGANGCSSTSSTIVNVSSGTGTTPATPVAIIGNITVCDNTLGVTYSIAPVANATSYNWEVSAGTIVSGQGTTAITVNFPATYTSLTVKVQAINSCGTAGLFRSLIVRSPVKSGTPGVVTGDLAVCAGSTGKTYSIAPVANAVSYYWETSAGTVTTPVNGTSISMNFPATYTSLTVKVQSINTCGIRSIFRTVTVKPPTVAGTPGLMTGDLAVCAGSTGKTYSIAPVANAVSYYWETSAGTVTTPVNGTSISMNFPATYTSLTVKVQSINTCGVRSTFRTVTVKPPVATIPGVISGPVNAVCGGSTGLIYSIAPVAGATGYNWVPSAGTITGGQGTNSITLNVPATYASLTLRVQSYNSCGTASSLNKGIVVRSLPVRPSAITGPAEPCTGSTVTYTVPVTTGAASYVWTAPGGWTINSGQGSTSVSVTPGSTGGYMQVYSSNNCGNSTVMKKLVGVIACLQEPAGVEVSPNEAEQKLAPNILNIYPNPATNKVMIQGEGITDIQLFDLSGKMLEAKRFNEENQIAFELNYPSGVYFIQVSGQSWTATQKLMITH